MSQIEQSLLDKFKELSSQKETIDKDLQEITDRLSEERRLKSVKLSEIEIQVYNLFSNSNDAHTIKKLPSILRSYANNLETISFSSVQKNNLHDILLEEAERPPGIDLPKTWALSDVKIPRGRISLLGAFSGIGKSRTLLNLAVDALKNQHKVIIFSLEMTIAELVIVFLQIHLRITKTQKHTSKNILDIVKKPDTSLDEILRDIESHIHFVDSTGWTAQQMIDYYHAAKEPLNGEPDIVLIDYLQIIRPINSEADRRNQIIQTVELMTNFAKETNSAWVLAAQTNRDSHKENKKKSKDGSTKMLDHSSYQESAAIEQNAFLAIQLKRDLEENSNKLELHVTKNRRGPTKVQTVKLDMETGAIIGKAPNA